MTIDNPLLTIYITNCFKGIKMNSSLTNDLHYTTTTTLKSWGCSLNFLGKLIRVQIVKAEKDN